MRILVTNNHLARFGGTESWVLTMVRELVRQGHDVGVYTHSKGVVSDLLKEHLDDNPQDYDLALINHNTCINVGARKKIYTCHSPFIDIEMPPEGMDVYVAVSDNIKEKYDLPHLIKNPIDTELYSPKDVIRETPERILAVTEVNVPFPVLRPVRTRECMPELINESDLVITIGRGVLESMSCGRNVIVWDNRPNMGLKTDGYLTLPITGNVGGPYTLSDIEWDTELKKYRKEHGARNREYILKHHDVKNIVHQYLNL